MATANLSSFDSLLKIEYQKYVHLQFEDKNRLYNLLEKETEFRKVGQKAFFALETTRHFGHGARAEDTDLPTAGKAGYGDFQVTLRNNYARCRWTGQVLRAAKGDRRTFKRSFKSEINSAMRGLKKDCNKQWNGDGSQILTKLSGSGHTSSTVFSVSHTRNLEAGMVIDIIIASSGTDTHGTTSATIDSISGTDVTITGATLSDYTSLDATYAVYVAGNRNIGMMGIDGIVDNRDPGDIQTSGYGSFLLAVASNAFWKATRDTTGGDISTDLIRGLTDAVDIAAPAEVDEGDHCFFSRHGQFRQYGNTVIQDRRYVGKGGNATKFEGGYQTLMVEGREWGYDKNCLTGQLFLLHKPSLKIMQETPPTWVDLDGHILSRVADRDAVEAYLVFEAELITKCRANHGKLTGLNEPS